MLRGKSFDWTMVAEHSHKKDGQICAAISKKKRKKNNFSSKIRENILKP